MRSDVLLIMGDSAWRLRIPGRDVAQEAQRSLIGASKAELDMCAGFQTKSERIDADTEMRSYSVPPIPTAASTCHFR